MLKIVHFRRKNVRKTNFNFKIGTTSIETVEQFDRYIGPHTRPLSANV